MIDMDFIKRHLAEPQEIELGEDKIKMGIVPMELSYKLFFLQDKMRRIYLEVTEALKKNDSNFTPTVELDKDDYNDIVEIIKSCILSANPDFPKEHLDSFVISNLTSLLNGVMKIHTFGLDKSLKIKEMLKNGGNTGTDSSSEAKKE